MFLNHTVQSTKGWIGRLVALHEVPVGLKRLFNGTDNKMPKGKILVVDDEPIIRNFFAAALSSHGFEFVLAEDVGEGLRLFERFHDEFNLIILDVSMPKLGGVELARRMLELTPNPNIVLMTGYSPDFVVPQELQEVCGLLMKPFNARRLIDEIEKGLKAERTNIPNRQTYMLTAVKSEDAAAVGLLAYESAQEGLHCDAKKWVRNSSGRERIDPWASHGPGTGYGWTRRRISARWARYGPIAAKNCGILDQCAGAAKCWVAVTLRSHNGVPERFRDKPSRTC